jgi:hypothetical protein
MKVKKVFKYRQPIARWSFLESEGIICLSAKVTVDELSNVNANDDATAESYLEDPIVF